jgi:hypothetical protein
MEVEVWQKDSIDYRPGAFCTGLGSVIPLNKGSHRKTYQDLSLAWLRAKTTILDSRDQNAGDLLRDVFILLDFFSASRFSPGRRRTELSSGINVSNFFIRLPDDV